jgi:DNA-binding CsgD family transcriptional regulator
MPVFQPVDRVALTERTERAIEACYDAALTPALWPDALQRLGESVGALSCNFYCHLVRRETLPSSSAHEGFAELWRRNQEFAPMPHIERRGRLPGLRRKFRLEHDVSTEEERRTLPYYQETARPAGHDWYACVCFSVDGNPWCLPVFRGAKQGPFTPKEGRYLAGIGPHLARVVRLAESFAATNLATGLSALEQLKCAALVIDDRGVAINLNGPAQKLLGDDFNVRAGRPVARDRASNHRLQQLIASALAAKRGTETSYEPAVIARAEAPWLIADAMPVTSFGSDLFNAGRVVLVLTDLTLLSVPDETRLRLVFSLTAAEAKLAKTMASGNGIEAAAALLRVNRETARTQLKAVFAKTNTSRQAELVALVARFRPSLSS